MKKIAILFCLVATLLSFYGCKKNYTHGVYEMTISAECISNDSVGNDWTKEYKCEGKTIKNIEQWTLPLNTTKKVRVDAKITGRDIWDDVGTGHLSVILMDGYETSTYITVTEDKVRYRRNKAEWKITCSVELVKKIEQK